MVLWISNLLHEGDSCVNTPYDPCLFNIRYAAAEECCSISLALDENNAKAYLMRAKARAKLGKLELAIQGWLIMKAIILLLPVALPGGCM